MKLLIVLSNSVSDAIDNFRASSVTEIVIVPVETMKKDYPHHEVIYLFHCLLSYTLTMMSNLESLKIVNVGDVQLPNGMNTLKRLNCNSNGMSSLPYGMISLEDLDCDNNRLEEIPHDMISLKTMTCSNNMLTSIPRGLHNLRTLICKGNQLRSLDVSEMKHLTLIDCGME